MITTIINIVAVVIIVVVAVQFGIFCFSKPMLSE